jgi:Arc/MetJ family transcription regulator
MGDFMATNLDVDDKLIDAVKQLGGHKSKKDAVTAALNEYIQRRKQQEVIELFGTIDYDPKYDYKKQRTRA